MRLACRETGLSPPVKYFTDRSKVVLLLWIICVIYAFVCHAFASVHCCLVVNWRERADLLALVCIVQCDFVTFPFGILGQVWYLTVLIPILAVFLTSLVVQYTCIYFVTLLK